MKGLKKLLTGLLAASMLAGMTMGVSAATVSGSGSTGTISVTNAVSGQEYSVYKILDFELSASASGTSEATGVYKLKGDDWDSFIESSGYFDIDENNYVTAKSSLSANIADFAKSALSYASENNISAEASGTADDDGLEFTNLGYGYFLLDSSTGALCALDTSTPEVDIEEKNGVPTVDKEVLEGESWGSTNDAELNDVVSFRTTITAQAGAQNYVLHDKMTEGLTLSADSIVVTSGDTTLTAGTDYTVTTDSLSDGCSFEIKFADSYLNTITAESSIVVTYSAKINQNAIVASGTNDNETWLDYGDSSTTEHDTTNTYIYKFDIVKYTGSVDSPTYLAGATFSLYRDEAATDLISLVKTGDNEYRLAVDSDVSSDIITEVTTDSTGKITINGLDEDSYYLVETAAPSGYTKLTSPITVKITKADSSADGKRTIYQDGETATQIMVLNNTGSLLPSTGGIGTTLFYIIGGILVVAACAFFIFKRKRD